MALFNSRIRAVVTLLILVLSLLVLSDLYLLPIPVRLPFGGINSSKFGVDLGMPGSKGAGLPLFCDHCGPEDAICRKWGCVNPSSPR